MVSLADIDDIVLNGGIVLAADGEKIGSVEQVFVSDSSGDPAFVTVRTGLFSMSETFVPLAGASIDGTRINVLYTKDLVKNGPRIASDRGSITTGEERVLYGYYGLKTEETAPQEEASASSLAEAIREDSNAAGTSDAARTPTRAPAAAGMQEEQFMPAPVGPLAAAW
ncbi:PRC-barrel domain-containing protein [Pseudarthrobacter sp. S9]|uniref:PRC-barrel domain-containing protein n=1 Tax=Pseudarthrobacter sp. S9 TaxID=3418421 RepID=UPI003D08DC69